MLKMAKSQNYILNMINQDKIRHYKKLEIPDPNDHITKAKNAILHLNKWLKIDNIVERDKKIINLIVKDLTGALK